MTKPSLPDTPKPERFEIEVFRPGQFTPMAGDAISFSAEDLSAIAAAYDADAHPAPIVVGHPSTDAPAFGWIEEIRYDGEAERLIATVGDVEPAFAEAVRSRRYRKVSIALFSPSAPANPKPGGYYAKHLGFLGAAAPAVPGLRPVQFCESAEKTVEIEFSDPGFRDVAGVMRRFRDFFIDQFGLEKADEVLPAYEIDWIERNADEPPSPHYAAPVKKEQPVKHQDDPAFAARQADVERREKILADRETKRLNEEHVAFAETLIAEGRLLPVKKDETVALLDHVAKGEDEAPLSFATSDGRMTTASAVDTLKGLLKAVPVQVDYDRQDMGREPAAESASFSAPDGLSVDRDALETHAKASAFQRQNPGTDWLTAVAAVS